MSLQTTSLSQPIAEPVTVAEVKGLLNLTSTADDTKVARLITAARVFAEKVTCMSLVSKTYVYGCEGFPGAYEPFRLPVPPVSAVSSVTYLDPSYTSQTWDASEYFLALTQMPGLIVPKPGIVYPATARARGLEAVQVNLTAGPQGAGALQLDLSVTYEGIRRFAVHLYEHPEMIAAENLKDIPYGLQVLLGSTKYHVHY